MPNNADLRGNAVIRPVVIKEPATASAQVVAVLTYINDSDEWRGRMELSADGGTLALWRSATSADNIIIGGERTMEQAMRCDYNYRRYRQTDVWTRPGENIQGV